MGSQSSIGSRAGFRLLSPPPPPGSSTDISEDWEKDFDLDMTEEEVQLALSKASVSGEVSPCSSLTRCLPWWQGGGRSPFLGCEIRVGRIGSSVPKLEALIELGLVLTSPVL